MNQMLLPPNLQQITDHFERICRSDTRVVAAFLGGSYASGKADAYSDLDLYVITTDVGYESFLAERDGLVHQLGQPLFLDDFGTPHVCFFILSDGTEGELSIGRESDYRQIHGGPYRVLLDKTGILKNANFPLHKADEEAQIEMLRQQLNWFWHDMFHFIKALARQQLWFACGELEILRRICLNLARLRHNFLDPDVGDEPHFKLDEAVTTDFLEALEGTYCEMERGALLEAGETILDFYLENASILARQHGVTYPHELERFVRDQLKELDEART